MTITDLAALAKGLAPLFQAIAMRLSALEVKEKGLDGAVGAVGPRGPVGPAARDGRDGLSVAGPQGEKGMNGADGRHGVDGLGFDDLSVLHDGERGFTFRFLKGDRIKEFAVTMPVMLYRGVYAEGKSYDRGDTVTWAGQLYHCQKPTMVKPEDMSRDWQLAAKRGRDAK